MTTTLTDKQLQTAYHVAHGPIFAEDSIESHRQAFLAGLRAVADLAITQADSEIHALKAELALLQKPDK